MRGILAAAAASLFLLVGCASRAPAPATESAPPGLVPVQSDQDPAAESLTAVPPVPPTPPHHKSWAFNGTALTTSDPVTGWNSMECGDCTMEVSLGPDLVALLFEAVMDNGTAPQPNPTGMARFYYSIEGPPQCFLGACPPVADLMLYGGGGNPLHSWENGTLPDPGDYVLRLAPQGFVPEAQKPFFAVMTAFYGTEPAPAWSYLAGDR